MIRSIGSAVLAGALALLAASGVALADGALLAPATLSDAPAAYLTVAMAPNGYAVAAWNQPLDGGQFALAVATRPPGATGRDRTSLAPADTTRSRRAPL